MKTKLFAAFALAVTATSAASAADEPTIAGAVSKSKDHTVLLAAVKEAGLVDTLSDPKANLTVFGPTDAAFKALGDEKIKAVIADKDLLKKILTSHAVAGTVMAADVVKLNGQKVKTLSGAEFPIAVKDGKVMVGNATVTVTDIKCSNGVIHVIDAVLIPGK